MSDTKARNSIRAWALVAVAVTSAVVIGLSIWLIYLLSGPDWCARAIGAERAANNGRSQQSVDACMNLLRDQVDAIALNSHMVIGVNALALLVLVVIVLAGGRLSFQANRGGVSGAISSANDEAAAAQHVADEAQDAADDFRRPRRPAPAPPRRPDAAPPRRRFNVDDPDKD